MLRRARLPGIGEASKNVGQARPLNDALLNDALLNDALLSDDLSWSPVARSRFFVSDSSEKLQETSVQIA